MPEPTLHLEIARELVSGLGHLLNERYISVGVDELREHEAAIADALVRAESAAEDRAQRAAAVVEAARLVARYTVVNEIAARAMSEQALEALSLLRAALARVVAEEREKEGNGWLVWGLLSSGAVRLLAVDLSQAAADRHRRHASESGECIRVYVEPTKVNHLYWDTIFRDRLPLRAPEGAH